MSVICIYHDNCQDGFAAAWAVRHALGERVRFHAAHYGSVPPDVSPTDDVVIVDFSYPALVLQALALAARSVLVLDHHKTAQEALRDVTPAAPVWDGDLVALGLRGFCRPPLPNLTAVFDMERSGAGLAWDWFHPGQPRPEPLNRVEDRDLGGGIGDNPAKYPDTSAVSACLASHPMDFERWGYLMSMHPDDLAEEGKPILRMERKRAQELIANTGSTKVEIAGVTLPVASAPFHMASEVGALLAQHSDEGRAATYFDTARGRVWSLRSTRDGLPVDGIAKDMGGGGHARAAGFTIPWWACTPAIKFHQ